MATVEKISIALPAEMVGIIRQAVDAGEYASSSEAVRDALRDWTQKRDLRRRSLAELQAQWRTSLDHSGSGIAPDEVLNRLKSKYQRLIDAADQTS